MGLEPQIRRIVQGEDMPCRTGREGNTGLATAPSIAATRILFVELLQEANQEVPPFLVAIHNEFGSGDKCHNKAVKTYMVHGSLATYKRYYDTLRWKSYTDYSSLRLARWRTKRSANSRTMVDEVPVASALMAARSRNATS